MLSRQGECTVELIRPGNEIPVGRGREGGVVHGIGESKSSNSSRVTAPVRSCGARPADIAARASTSRETATPEHFRNICRF